MNNNIDDFSNKTKYLNLNLRNNLIINKKNKEIDKLDENLNDKKNKVNDNTNDKLNNTNDKLNNNTNKYNCKKCNLNFSDYMSLEKHNWSRHPSNEYENYHASITDWSNLPMAYRDDPYY